MKLTANHVTLIRIVLLPIPAFLLVTDPSVAWRWFVFFFSVFLGATDFVDGYMARRNGVTKLGSVLDPVADKLFIAALLLPLVMIEHCPWWMASLIFIREVWITALRSLMEVRGKTLKTSGLGKLKTAIQMGGLGTYFLTVNVPQPWMTVVHGMGAFSLLCLIPVWKRRNKSIPLWLSGCITLWSIIVLSSVFMSLEWLIWLQFLLMTLLSLISAWEYMYSAWPDLTSTQLYRKVEWSRLLWAVCAGVGLLPWMRLLLWGQNTSWAYEILLAGALYLSCALIAGVFENVYTQERHELLPIHTVKWAIPIFCMFGFWLFLTYLSPEIFKKDSIGYLIRGVTVLFSVIGLWECIRLWRHIRDLIHTGYLSL